MKWNLRDGIAKLQQNERQWQIAWLEIKMALHEINLKEMRKDQV